MDKYFWKFMFALKIRRALRQLKTHWRLRHPAGLLRLHLGCRRQKLEGYMNLDCTLAPEVDYVCDITQLPCRPDSVDRIEWYHVIEHIPLPLVEPTLRKYHALLKPGGRLVTECPNVNETVREYLAGNQERLLNIYGRQRFPGDAHHWGYTPESLSQLLKSIGFVDVVSKPPEGYHAQQEPCMRVECAKAAAK